MLPSQFERVPCLVDCDAAVETQETDDGSVNMQERSVSGILLSGILR